MEKFKIVKTSLGIPSIQFLGNGEIMHNPVGPWQEAHSLYLQPMDIIGRLSNSDPQPLVIFDVGLGAATNAVAALSAWQPGHRDLKIISFERDLDLLRFAYENRQEFPFLSGMQEALFEILQNGQWVDPRGGLSWELRYGEFDQCIDSEQEKAELIFFEPYSPKVNPEMWSISCFKSLFSCSKQSQQGALLATYSRATAVRAAMLLAGFYVGPGVAIGQKNETTLASTVKTSLPNIFGNRWMSRLKRSHIPFPEGTTKSTWPELFEIIENHPQFSCI